MPDKKKQLFTMFEFTPLDGREDIDDKVQRTYQNLKQMIANKSAKECHEIYLKFISTNTQQNTEELTMGLLVAILVEPDGQQSKYYRDVVSFSKDSLSMFSTYLNIIVIERLPKLKDHSIKQIFWILHQLMKAGINAAETICSNLLRQTAGGDLSARNIWLIENLLELLIENRNWLINSTSFMIPTIVYTLLRLISDHMGLAQSALKQKEVDFVIGLIREKFLDCMQIGRDFLRLLHNVNKIPEFEKLSNDIYNNPKTLHPTFLNPLQLLATRTPRRLFQSRLTFEMEKKISFLATQVKFGNQKRYQDWFHKQYLATPESLSLRCDLIRYICTIIHPSNEVLCSDIIPRWAIIGWLLTTCTTTASATNSKLALFFDWLLYDAKVDNIMNIEPVILVMYYSMRSHPNVTSSLLDFLCRLPTTFSPKLSEHLKAGIKKSLQQILEKRVVQSLAPIFDNPKHDSALKALIRETYPEFCNSVIEQPTVVKVTYPFMIVPNFDFKETLNSFDEPIRCILEDFNLERCNETRCGLMDKLISVVFDNSNEQSANSSMLKDLGHCIAHLIADDFSTKIFPSSSPDNESLLQESIASPFFILCRSAFSNSKPSYNTRPISLLASIAKAFEATGFLVLYFLRVTSLVGGNSVSINYIEFCNTAKRKLSKCLYDDLFMAMTYDSEMFCFLLPSIYGELASSGSFPITGNTDLLRLVVSALDPIYLQELMCLCLTSTARVINKEEVISLIETSLNWESWEQYCVWKLITAQNVPIENYISILPKLDTRANAEAMSSILLNLQKVSAPTTNMVQQVISCDCKPNDPYISSILRHWSMRTDIHELAKMISSLFDSRPSSPQVKRKGLAKTVGQNQTTLSSRSEKILFHLDSIRQRAPKSKLLSQAEIVEMITQMETLCNDNQKRRFADLFSNRPKTTKKQKRIL